MSNVVERLRRLHAACEAYNRESHESETEDDPNAKPYKEGGWRRDGGVTVHDANGRSIFQADAPDAARCA